jgi:hypothetical protein
MIRARSIAFRSTLSRFRTRTGARTRVFPGSQDGRTLHVEVGHSGFMTSLKRGLAFGDIVLPPGESMKLLGRKDIIAMRKGRDGIESKNKESG